MQSIKYTLEKSTDVYESHDSGDTSSAKFSFGTNVSGATIVPIERNESPDIEELRWEEFDWDTQEERKLHYLLKSRNIYFHNLIESEDKINFLPPDIEYLRLSLHFSEEVENLMIHNSLFSRFISQIEISLNTFLVHEKVNLKNSIYFEEDWEIPNYKKLVLSLEFQGIPFNREMELWKEINNLTYGRINWLIRNTRGEDSRKLMELKRNYFIKLKM